MQNRRDAPDFVVVAAILAMALLAAFLCVQAAQDPNTRIAIPCFIVGLAGAGMILFRQLRKARESLVASEARAQFNARHDELTKLPNRALLLERLRQRIGAPGAAPASLACIGLDRLPEVIEGLGHVAGDQVVLELASRLRSVCGPDDSLARTGDDEFAILLPKSTTAEAGALAERVLATISRPIDTTAGRVFVTSSVGVCAVESADDTPVQPLRRAKLAMSSARLRGGGVAAIFEPEMDRALSSLRDMEVELRATLSEGALRMVYQPQATDRGVIFGAEALMRWTSPTKGEVSPGVFMPLAERCGLSETLGEFALRHAMTDARRWPGLTIAVNVSAIQIRSGRIIETLRRLLDETGAQPARIELEITEGILLEDKAETLHTLHEIRAMGFKIALDDFGTGYSSLSYLRRFPVDKIKIDRAFITNLGLRPESDAIVMAIVNLATALDIKVIAEGVETKAQLDRLTHAGCHQVQGFLFGGPVEADDIGPLLAKAALAA